ncbi:MAG: hypothetical protein EHM36_13020 [Deltaproteobacteria bacterium]|nr:MAG: hypothetical protein EHM36_13020 [Deltaproteobacteria bacterium]
MGEKRAYDIIGSRIPEIEAFDKVTGAVKYTADIKLDRMLCGKILRSPHPHARINHIDITKAKALPGVIDIILGKDVPHNSRILGSTVNDQSVLTEDRVRYIGDAVAAVAALAPEIAEEALGQMYGLRQNRGSRSACPGGRYKEPLRGEGSEATKISFHSRQWGDEGMRR